MLIGCSLAGSALAQSNYFSGVTVRPRDVYNFPASLIAIRSLTILNNRIDYGSNVAVYGQANKFGLGTTWGGCSRST